MRHYQNEMNMQLLKLPFKAIIGIYNLIRGNLVKQSKAKSNEIDRLNMVIKSKQKAHDKMKFIDNSIIHWENRFLSRDGIFPIGLNENSNNVNINFEEYSNLLIGGLPGSGKTKLLQLLIYQCLLHNCDTYVADFKGGLDYQCFENKCLVIIDHQKLLDILNSFLKEIELRIKKFKKVNAENIKNYNEISGLNLKRTYLFIDEASQALQTENKELTFIIRSKLREIVRLGRALGCHVIVGTQRPATTVLDGDTRSMFESRFCFQADKVTSNMVLESAMAGELENCKGKGYLKLRNNLILTKCYLWQKDTINCIPNRFYKDKIHLVKNVDEEPEKIAFDLD